MSNKCPLILFSGGLDSTYLLWKEALNQENKYIDVVYGDAQQGEVKKDMEKAAQRRIIDKLYQDTDARSIFARRSYSRIAFADTPKAAFRQPLGWMAAAMEVVSPIVHTSVMIAYVEGDQIMQNLNDLKNAWEAIWSFTKQGPVVPLEFPLSRTSKVEILRNLPSEYYSEIWYCECPKCNDKEEYKACGTCVACVTHATERYRYSLTFGESLAERHAFLRSCKEDVAEVPFDIVSPQSTTADLLRPGMTETTQNPEITELVK